MARGSHLCRRRRRPSARRLGGDRLRRPAQLSDARTRARAGRGAGRVTRRSLCFGLSGESGDRGHGRALAGSRRRDLVRGAWRRRRPARIRRGGACLARGYAAALAALPPAALRAHRPLQAAAVGPLVPAAAALAHAATHSQGTTWRIVLALGVLAVVAVRTVRFAGRPALSRAAAAPRPAAS